MPRAQFERARLRLARELRGWSQSHLAREVDLTPAAISQFESGAGHPSDESLNRLSVALQVPAAFFTRPLLESHDGFFRALRRTSVTDRRRARALAHVAHDMVAGLSERVPPLTIPPITPPTIGASLDQIELIAREVRAAWKLPPGPVKNVVDLLEDHGVVVIRLPLLTADVDAFSLPFPDHPIVVLGTDKDDRARSRFDAAHELGHLVMHGEQMWGLKEIETQAHRFAAAFLMPRDEIFPELPTTIDWPRLFTLKKRWQVSLAALLMRARTLKRISEAQYISAIKAASARGWRRIEPVPLGEPEHPKLLAKLATADDTEAAISGLPSQLVTSIVTATAT